MSFKRAKVESKPSSIATRNKATEWFLELMLVVAICFSVDAKADSYRHYPMPRTYYYGYYDEERPPTQARRGCCIRWSEAVQDGEEQKKIAKQATDQAEEAGERLDMARVAGNKKKIDEAFDALCEAANKAADAANKALDIAFQQAGTAVARKANSNARSAQASAKHAAEVVKRYARPEPR